MQFEIEHLGPVRCRVQVEVPVNRVDSAFSKVYNQIAQQVSLPGFRRGKVPVAHLRKRYGAQARMDATQNLVEAAWRGLLDDHEIIPLGEPELDAQPVAQGKPFSVSFTFEVAPEVDVKPYDELSAEKVVWVVDEGVVADEIEQLAEHFASFETQDAVEVAAEGHMAVIDYAGSVDGELFPGGSATDAELVLGSGQFIPGFEEQIVGQTIGENFDVKVRFPAEYPAEHLADKDAVFACTLKGLKIKVAPEVGPALAEKAGEADMDALSEKVKADIEKRHNDQANMDARDAIKKSLGQAYDFELPEVLLTSAMNDKANQLRSEAMQAGGGSGDGDDAQIEQRLEAAKSDVMDDLRATLVLDTIGRNEDISIPPAEVNEQIEMMIRTTGPYGEQIRQIYRDPSRRAALARRLRHDKVLDFLLAKANVTTIEKAVPKRDQGDGHGQGEPNTDQGLENEKDET